MHDVLSYLANAFICASMGIFCFRLIKGTTTAEPIAWLIGCTGMLLQNITGYSLVNNNLSEMKFGIALNLCIAFIFVYSSIKGKFKKPSTLNASILLLALAIAIFRYFVKNDQIANVSVQAIFILSVIPTVQGLIQDKLKDHPLPWLLAIIAYSFQILTVITNPEGWTAYALVFPIVGGMIGNGSILITTWLKNKQNTLCEISIA